MPRQVSGRVFLARMLQQTTVSVVLGSARAASAFGASSASAEVFRELMAAAFCLARART